MSRSLPQRPNLDHLKREAKRILRAVKAGGRAELPLLRRLPKCAGTADAEISRCVTLLDVQQALARDCDTRAGRR